VILKIAEIKKGLHAVMWKQTAMWEKSVKEPCEVTLNIKKKNLLKN